MLLRLWPEKTAVAFMNLRLIALVVSLTALVASAALLGTRGLNLGIDFAGGAVIEVDKPEDVSADQIRSTVTGLVTGDVQVNSARGTGPNAPEIAVIRFEPQPPVGEETLAGGLANTIAGRICNYFDLKGGGYTVRLYFNPLVRFIWIGTLIMFFGGFLSLCDRRLRVGAPQRAKRVATAEVSPAE